MMDSRSRGCPAGPVKTPADVPCRGPESPRTVPEALRPDRLGCPPQWRRSVTFAVGDMKPVIFSE